MPSPAASTPAPSGSATPTPNAEIAEPTSVVVTPEDFSPTGSAKIRGTAQADSRVVVSTGGVELCAVEATDDGTFDCGSVRIPDGNDVEIVATETRAESGSDAPDPGTTRLDVLGPPRADGPRELLTTGLVAGTGRPGATVTVSVNGVTDAACSAIAVPASTYWSCNLTRASGVYTMRAQQSDQTIADGSISAFSNAQTLTIDRDAPAAAIITAPAPDATVTRPSVTVSGTGESGAAIDVYLDNVPACASSAIDGVWSCAIGGLTRGAHSLQAVIRDAAGNYAAPSATVRVVVGARATPTPSTTPTPAPSIPADPTTPAPPPDGEQPVPGDGGTAGPPSAELPGPVSRFDWSVPTGFGGGILSLVDTVSSGGWYASPLIALVFLALIAIPLRMLASALRGRVRLPRLTGRNRGMIRYTTESTGTPSPSMRSAWVRGVAAVAAAAGLVIISVGVAGEVRYLRLYLAIAIGLALLNLIGGVVATRLGARANGIRSTVRFLPIMLLAAAVTAVVSRMTDLEPPIITGVLVGAAFAAGTPARRRAAVSIAQVGVVTALGLIGWVLLGATGTTGGFWTVVANETLATICLAGLGSALVLVLPIASLPGRAILEWSPTAWVVTTLVVSTIAAGVVFGEVLVGLTPTPLMFVAAAFAAISLAVWGFVRFVEPTRA